MGTRMGLLGQKVGMTQLYDATGNCTPATVLELGPCVVLDIKTPERDGYSAVKLGFGEKKASRTTKAELGVFAKANTTPKAFVREMRLSKEECEQFTVGQTLGLDEVFKVGDTIDVVGTSRGKGFQGVMKRYHFGGFRATHGTHEQFRHGGSIGCRLTPGRVMKGTKMPGQMGNKRVTVQNITIAEIVADKNLMLIKGAVPGAPDGRVMIKHAIKRLRPPFQLHKPEPAASTEESATPA